MKALAHAVGRVVALADRAAELLIVALFAAIVLVGGLQVLCRYAFNASLSWSEEFQRYGLIWIVFLAIVVGYRRGAHIGMGLFLEKMPRAVQRPMGVCIDFLWLALGGAMVVFTAAYASASGLTFWRSVARQSSAGMGVRMDVIYACIVIGGVYLVLAALHNLLRRAAGEAPVILAERPPC
ncbi:MAG: TRAP transporter small permease [Opitutaceae bacterium]|nr:TRAP transporter small permease [Opitutaceae bacterium]